ncbi:MAG TPA: DUF2298 domain-containing protein, partial [Candidatus Goldiibacteriota bacterium]|nr:DUF2298 domain-containing protein [Candidatus Goldiibacteriota bacterium]
IGLWVLFGIIMLAGLFLRLYQPDWYADRQFHPDERWIVGSAVPGLNYPDKPIGLQYGSLPLYILSFYKNFLNDLRNNGWVKNLDTNRELIGGARVMSGLVDAGTIVFVFLAAMLLFGPKPALFSAALLAFTPLHIHAAHFFTVDTFMAFFLSAMIYFCARIYKYGTLPNYILAGVFYGAALASKIAASPAALAIFGAHFLYFLSIKGKTASAREEKLQSWINLGWAALTAFAAFFVFMPHALLDFRKFMADNDYQRRILVTGEGDVPYNRQYLNTMPYLYYIKNLVFYTMGIPLALVSLFAFAFYPVKTVMDIIKKKAVDLSVLVPLAWLIPYFAIVGASFGKFNRYMLPFTPFIIMLAGKFLYDFAGWVREKKWAGALKAATLAGAVFYGLAFMNVYTNSHTWIQASRWIYKNIPETQFEGQQMRKTTILNEMWGDDLPVYADGKGSWVYNITKWNVQEPDSPQKLSELSFRLNEADYVAMADRRAYGTYLRLPKRYPLNYYYFSTMMKEPEKLGFKKVLDLAVYPSLFGINIVDEGADESFQLYDHPHVFIFKNEKRYGVEELRGLLAAGENEVKQKFGTQSGRIAGYDAPQKGLNNPNIGQLKDRVTGIAPFMSVFMWYLAVQLLAFIFLPLHFKALGNLRDKGYGLAKVSGIFLFAWINWIVVSLGAWKFYQVNLWILLAALAALSCLAYMKMKEEASAFVRDKKLYILMTEAFFLGAYMLFVFVKMWCPDIHNVMGHGYNGGGEPMGMAYLSAIFNAVKFPPHDPWLGGFTLNYYYWGQLMLATVSKLLGYFPRVTYNLSLALLFALCFISAFSMAYNMTGKYRYALLGGFLLAMAGNFHTMIFTLDRLVNTSGIQQFLTQLGSFQFIWDPTRIYPSPVITELPFFSYLYGDLHAHNIVIPVTVLAAAFVYNILKAPNKTVNIAESFGAGVPQKLITGVLLSLGLGSMLTINTWNFPPVLILVATGLLMLGFNLYRENFVTPKKASPAVVAKNAAIPAVAGLMVIAAVAVVAYLLFEPFHSNFQSPYKSVPHLISKPERASLEVMMRYFNVFFLVIFAFMYFVWEKGVALFDRKAGLFRLKMRKFDADKIMSHIEKVGEKAGRSPALLWRMIAAGIVTLVFLILLLVETTFAFLFL